jgi:nitrite reductase (NADH) small subunit
LSAGWRNLGPASRIPLGEGRTFSVDGHDVAVFRARDGAVFATQASCPHRGGPLADGVIGAGVVICPYHAFRFDLASGAAIGHDCGALQTYAIEVDANGNLVVCLESVAEHGTFGTFSTPQRCP